jgi:methionine synthase I (cobalamin-dependent)
MQSALQELLKSEKMIVADGAVGTVLISLGVGDPIERTKTSSANPEIVRNVHRDYIDAGAQIILTNTLQCNRLALERHYYADHRAELN